MPLELALEICTEYVPRKNNLPEIEYGCTISDQASVGLRLDMVVLVKFCIKKCLTWFVVRSIIVLNGDIVNVYIIFVADIGKY